MRVRPSFKGNVSLMPMPSSRFQHEGDAARDVGVEGQRDQVEHVAIVIGRFAFGGDIQIQMRVALLLQRDVDPLLRSNQS